MLVTMIINNPMIYPRYKVAGLAFFLIDYMLRGKKPQLLAVIFAAGILMAPVFNVFRNGVYSHEANTGGITVVSHKNPFADTFLSYDYDAFITSSYTFLKVSQDGITYGTNLLGAALSFVPRAIWPDKPRPTPFILYDLMTKHRFVGTDNLSSPL
ncbi:MAG: hypothetical protein HY221_01725, partial [Candidatus Sungbacteria bacterium]|nr:hypothetical protein [Candidatus Sungbacteria bacterium]